MFHEQQAREQRRKKIQAITGCGFFGRVISVFMPKNEKSSKNIEQEGGEYRL